MDGPVAAQAGGYGLPPAMERRPGHMATSWPQQLQGFGKSGMAMGSGDLSNTASSHRTDIQEPWWCANTSPAFGPSPVPLPQQSVGIEASQASAPATSGYCSSRSTAALEELQAYERSYASGRPNQRALRNPGPPSPMPPHPAEVASGGCGRLRWMDEAQPAVIEHAERLSVADRSRPSDRLRELLDSVATAEVQNEVLQEQNYRFRIRCLQFLRENSLRSLVRAALNAWVAAVADARGQQARMQLRAYYLQKFTPMLSRWLGSSSQAMAANVLSRWRSSLEALRDENRLLKELEAHRNGRTQLIQQYRDLEAEFLQERRRGQECRAQLEECASALETTQQELGWATSGLQAQGREADDLRSKVRALEGRLQEGQDQSGNLKRELRSQTERARRLELQLEVEAREKSDLHETLLRAERVAEGLRSETARLEQVNAQNEAILHDKDAHIAALEAQIGEMRGVISLSIESLTRGKSVVEAKAPMDALAQTLQLKRDSTPIPALALSNGPVSPEGGRVEHVSAHRRMEDAHMHKEYSIKEFQFAKEKLQYMH